MNKNNFSEIPELLKAVARDGLVLFIGAGVSRLAGGASWDQFAENCLNFIRDKDWLSFAEAEQISALPTKEKLSIAQNILDIKNYTLSSNEFEELITSGDNAAVADQLLRSIVSMGIPIVTTNYDTILEKAARKYPTKFDLEYPSDPKVFYDIDEITSKNLEEKRSIIQLHGSIKNPTGAVISDVDYFKYYNETKIIHFLEGLFTKKNILFLGYGLEEAELLAHLFRLTGNKYKSKKRYWFRDYFAFETHLLQHQTSYFKKAYDIEILPYYKDNRGYEELAYFVEALYMSIPVPDPTHFNSKLDVIKEAFDD